MGSNSPKTLGIEFESVIMSRDAMASIAGSSYFNPGTIKTVTRDASVESEVANIGENVSVFLGNSLLHRGFGNRPKMVIGYELVTNPLSIDDTREIIKKMCALQVKYGEMYSDIHTGYPAGLIFGKTSIALGLKVEPLFFKIAGMGSKFRGLSNNSAYCRPLAIPPAMPLMDSNKMAILDPIGAVSANGSKEFWNKLGVNEGDHDRYNPLRYFAINTFSTVLRGTLEFRFFNFTSVARYIEAVVGLSQTVSDLMQRISLRDISGIRQLSLCSENGDSAYIQLLDNILYLSNHYNVEYKMESKDINTIRELIYETPQPVFNPGVTASHIKTARYSEDFAKSAGLKIINKAPEPGIVDIHNFADESRSLLGDN